jgi:hypothetical protein
MKFQDLADSPEDVRIARIGEAAETGQTVAFVTDADPGKADRYIQKLLTRFPALEVTDRFDGPVPGTVSVKVRRKGRIDDHLTTDRADPGLENIKPNGQQEAYLVLSDEERAKGFVRPVRQTYKHVACGTVTTMGRAIAETYARDPKFYGGTFCCHCGQHFRLTNPDGKAAFVWDPDGTPVGS